jgi:hypothetical protein
VQRGNDRQPCFFAEADYRFYLDSLGAAAQHYAVQVHAYVLMANHIHLLVTPLAAGASSCAGNGIGDQDGDASLFVRAWIMKTIYYPQDDILEIHLSDKPVAREVSQDWNVNVSYAEDGSVVELVILDAVKAGFMPFEGGDRKAA